MITTALMLHVHRHLHAWSRYGFHAAVNSIISILRLDHGGRVLFFDRQGTPRHRNPLPVNFQCQSGRHPG